MPILGDALVERARSTCATLFLTTDADVLMSIDSDIVNFTPEHVQTVCEGAEEHGVVSGLYVTRGTPVSNPRPSVVPMNGVEINLREPELVEMRWLPQGFIAVHRRVFEEMKKTLPVLHELKGGMWPFYQTFEFDDPDEGRILLGEDWAFCERARQAGFKSYLDPSVTVGHVGSYIYSIKDLGEYPRTLQLSHMNWIVRQ
ncbi:hypothetical protein LCGC14_1291590 [marine sediment metagenome]|uniref:Glycosyltransferase 2-like domain-containing protein n=1 Tax=marine sediment metagenome TaxID=412755 RepID=A0A0F9KTX6_9ZZZZ